MQAILQLVVNRQSFVDPKVEFASATSSGEEPLMVIIIKYLDF